MLGGVGFSFALKLHAKISRLKWSLNLPPLSPILKCVQLAIHFSARHLGAFFFRAFLNSSSVAAFCGPNSDGRNGVCFATSCHVWAIVAPEALHSLAVFLSILPDACWINEWRRSCANASSEGERCMKHTIHPIRHPSVHPWIFGRVGSRRSCAWYDDQFGRGQNTGLGWSDPSFVHVSVPKVMCGVAPAQLRGDRAECFVRVQMGRRTTQKTVWSHSNSQIEPAPEKGGHSHADRE